MHRILASLLILSAVSATAVAAQSRSDIEVVRSQLRSDRQAVIASNLPLSEAESAAFWPVYREYQAELTRNGDRLVQLIARYAEKQDKLTDADAESLLKEYLDTREAKLRLQRSFVRKFLRVLPASQVARYYQIENKIDAIVDIELATGVPLIPAKQ